MMHKVRKAPKAVKAKKTMKTKATKKTAKVHKTTKRSLTTSTAKKATRSGPMSKAQRFMSTVGVDCPPLGDSVLEGDVVEWKKNIGDWVNEDDALLVLETAKVSVDIPAPKSGILTAQFLKIGDVAKVGDKLCEIDTAAAKPAGGAAPAAPKPPAAAVEALAAAAKAPAAPAAPVAPKQVDTPAAAATAPVPTNNREDRRVKMNRMRQTIASRLKETQNRAALLTTFNEIDMTNAIKMRKTYKDEFEKVHNTKLGFMSIFMAAATQALQMYPDVNAAIEGNEIVYRNYVDISVAVATPTGLVVPVIRDCQAKSLAQLEQGVADYAKKARNGSIAMEDFVGGTFTISNGGVYGSLFGTPIVNGNQTAILGMHATNQKAHVVDGKVEVRPIMIVALSYDHRLIDGSTAVQCLKAIKNGVENPERLLLKL